MDGWMDGLKSGSNSPAALLMKSSSTASQGELPHELLQLPQVQEKLWVFPPR